MDAKFKTQIQSISSAVKVSPTLSLERKQFNYRRYPLIHNQAMYVLSLSNQEIAYTKNIEHLLGYEEAEFTYDLAFSLIHPDDYPVVMHIVKSIFIYYTDEGMPRDSVLYLTYRIKRKDGNYIKVQRTSGICRVKRNKTLDGNYSILQDISYLNLGNAVRWKWDSPSIESGEFQRLVEFSPRDVFTPKQSLIFEYLQQEFTEKEIAERMGVKPSTIKTQKKRMLLRLNCKNVTEMMEYFEKNYPSLGNQFTDIDT